MISSRLLEYPILENTKVNEVDTQRPDGEFGNLQRFLSKYRNISGENLLLWVKEYQWRRNCKKKDLWIEFCTAWGVYETDRRNGILTHEISCSM